MKLTLDQALQKGIEAHKAGQVQEAAQLYMGILKALPRHPDANHNLGVLAASLNQLDAALPLLKAALDADPAIEQFWISYIDALIKEKQLKHAKRVIQLAKTAGFFGERFDALGEQLTQISHSVPEKKLVRFIPPQTKVNCMLASYQNGQYEVTQDLALSITKEFPNYQLSWKILGAVLGQVGRLDDALIAIQRALELDPKDANSYSNLGIILNDLGRFKQAETAHMQALLLKPNFIEAHYNLGNTFKKLDRLEDAEASYKKAISLKPDYALAHSNLGNVMIDLGRLGQAEASYRKAIALKPDYAEAHYNLANIMVEKGRLEQAESSYRQAIILKPNYAKAYTNLSMCLKDKGDLVSALAVCKKSISLNPKSSISHFNMGIILYGSGDVDAALVSVEKANYINPKAKKNKLLLTVLKARKAHGKTEPSIGSISNLTSNIGLTSNPLIINRVVEPELVANLYEMNSRELNTTKDARYGNGRCSSDFDLFEENRPIIKNVAEDLTSIMMKAVKSDIYVWDSFFNIIGAGGGSIPHNHLNQLDEDDGLNLAMQKYSLVYYLSVGNQHCNEPGILKLYGPSEDILPTEGMIVIVPAGREHSAIYGGEKDRVMIGINFYSL